MEAHLPCRHGAIHRADKMIRRMMQKDNEIIHKAIYPPLDAARLSIVVEADQHRHRFRRLLRLRFRHWGLGRDVSKPAGLRFSFSHLPELFLTNEILCSINP